MVIGIEVGWARQGVGKLLTGLRPASVADMRATLDEKETVKEREKPSHCNVNYKNESDRNTFKLVTLAVCTDPVGSVHRRDQAPNALSPVCYAHPIRRIWHWELKDEQDHHRIHQRRS